LPSWMPLIGFSGSPFTLASYAIEGGGSRQYPGTKRMMHAQPQAFADLLHLLSDAVIAYLNQQIAAGAQCVQLFDSWVGCLSPSQYVRHVLPHMKHILANITPGVPVINFGTGNPELLPLMRGDYRTVVGVDWRIPLDIAWQRIGFDRPVQGNLDQSVLLSDEETIAQAVRDVLSRAGQRPGHIFNLGHGIMKETPVENAIRCVEMVKEFSQVGDTNVNDSDSGNTQAEDKNE
ncbi:MAG: uroporphyrinogen decarboxylase family protein, partial [Planctomycetota bacterium]